MKTPSSYTWKVSLVCLSLLFFQQSSYAQCFDTSLRKPYYAPFGVTSRSQSTLNDGGVLINGFRTVPLTQTNQPVLVKLAANGDVIWGTTIESSPNSVQIEIQQILELASGDYLLAGVTNENNSNKIFLAKLNIGGSLLWSRSFTLTAPSITSPDFKGFYALAEDPITGKLFGSLQVTTILSSGTPYDINVIASFNQNGTSSWSKYFYHLNIEPYSNFSGLEVINSSVISVAESAMYFPGDSEESPSFLFTKINSATGLLELVRCYKVMPDPYDSTTANGGYTNARLHSQSSVKTPHSDIIISGLPIKSTLKNGILAKFDSTGNFKSGRNLYRRTNSAMFYQPLTQVAATATGRLITLIRGDNLQDTYLTAYDSLFRIELQQKISSPLFNFNNTSLFKNISVNTNESQINLIHNYSSPGPQGTYQYHFELQKFFPGQSALTNCFGTEGLAEIMSPMELEEHPFSYQSINDISLNETIIPATALPLTITEGGECSYYSNCNSIAIIEAPIICHLDRAYTFKATKGPACNKRVLWTFIPSADNIISQLNDSTISVTFLDDWQGQVIASLSGDCNISDTVNLALQLSPDSVFLGDDLVLCPQTTHVLDAGDNFNIYTWNDGSHLQQLSVSLPGTYWVAAENFCGEIYRDTIIITASSYSLNIDPIEEKCNLDTIKIARNSALLNYAISPNNNYSIFANEISFWPLSTTTYTITAQTPDGCILRDTMRVVVQNSPPIYLGIDTKFCTGDSLLLNAGNLLTGYIWNDGFTGPQRWIKQSGIYHVAATYSNGCISRDTINILPPIPLPIISLSKKSIVCRGQNNTLTAPSGYDSYLWQDGSAQSSFTVNSPGKYFVRVTAQGCVNSDTVEITKVALATTDFLPVDTSVCYSDKVMICSKKVDNSYEYVWSNGRSTSCIEVDRPGVYTLQLTNNEGCSATEEIEIKDKQCAGDIYFPNSFTPNNDNLNDSYKAKSYSRLAHYKIIIYNRWGQRVFISQNISEGWDGRFAGAYQEQGVYTWYCEYAFDGKERNIRKGTLLLIR